MDPGHLRDPGLSHGRLPPKPGWRGGRPLVCDCAHICRNDGWKRLPHHVPRLEHARYASTGTLTSHRRQWHRCSCRQPHRNLFHCAVRGALVRRCCLLLWPQVCHAHPRTHRGQQGQGCRIVLAREAHHQPERRQRRIHRHRQKGRRPRHGCRMQIGLCRAGGQPLPDRQLVQPRAQQDARQSPQRHCRLQRPAIGATAQRGQHHHTLAQNQRQTHAHRDAVVGRLRHRAPVAQHLRQPDRHHLRQQQCQRQRPQHIPLLGPILFRMQHRTPEGRRRQPHQRPDHRAPQHRHHRSVDLAQHIEGVGRHLDACHHRRNHRHRQRHDPVGHRKPPQQDLQRKDRPGKWHLIHPGQSRSRPTGHQQPAHLLVDAQPVTDPSTEQRTQLPRCQFASDGGTRTHRHDLQQRVHRPLEKGWVPAGGRIGRDCPLDPHHGPPLHLQPRPAQRYQQSGTQQRAHPPLRRRALRHDA